MVAGLLLALSAAPAHAGTVYISCDWLYGICNPHYFAAKGEVNRVHETNANGRSRFEDAGSPLILPINGSWFNQPDPPSMDETLRNCDFAGTSATCRVEIISMVHLGDRNDVATIENSAAVECGAGFDTVYVVNSNNHANSDCERVIVR